MMAGVKADKSPGPGLARGDSMVTLPAPPPPSLHSRCSASTPALPTCPAPSYHNTEDFFALVQRLQGCRLDDQRCALPGPLPPARPARARLERLLAGPGPHPLVSPPPDTQYWCDPPVRGEEDGQTSNSPPPARPAPQDEAAGLLYRSNFLPTEHYNFLVESATDCGPALLSLRYTAEAGVQSVARTGAGTTSASHLNTNPTPSHFPVPAPSPGSAQSPAPSPTEVAARLWPGFTSLQPILCPQAGQLLAEYDAQQVVTQYKFGAVSQRVGQTSEESMFSNRDCPGLLELLDSAARRVDLAQHGGYRGGLDTQYGQTGQQSYYTQHQGKEVMFHVAPLLPYSDTDRQQLQRKRHIGNDIVALVFQEGDTPFSPDIITSHFLHAYIVVRPEPQQPDRYRVAVTARADVPGFGPALPSPPVLQRGPHLRQWLLDKLVNAETACYQAVRFRKLKQRTQLTLLNNLASDLSTRTREFLSSSEDSVGKMTKVEPSFFKNVKKVIASRTRSQGPSETWIGVSTPKLLPKSKSSNFSKSVVSKTGDINHNSSSSQQSHTSSHSTFYAELGRRPDTPDLVLRSQPPPCQHGSSVQGEAVRDPADLAALAALQLEVRLDSVLRS